ncbi:hypothetical protein BO85DRAFT_453965 [Aspergillus piperis CBS 112811]|uniref:Uncharacterized protein n=1 Tax=Aspergillus piperis CBS 112811 TaxID=1448313 RepID=A0A8G1QUH1_9EURO|nr:hypothetical protein BO85DRAFT_453965 [Aspergillus piperis CBS 112811]RAH52440.1 hypothetical protein BO85DRAFT_453965 [Aspergillus piperis CBS 112811]
MLVFLAVLLAGVCVLVVRMRDIFGPQNGWCRITLLLHTIAIIILRGFSDEWDVMK